MKTKTSFATLKSELGLGWAIFTIAIVIIASLGLCFGLMCFEAWLIMLLWNAVLPAVITIILPITFWQAMCLLLLCNFLFERSIVKGISNIIDKKNE